MDFGDILPYVGGAAGFALGGPAGGALGYGAGSVVGNALSEDEIAAAQENKQRMMREVAARYAAEKKRLVPARTNALNQQLAQFQGPANALATMYGPQAMAAPPAGQGSTAGVDPSVRQILPTGNGGMNSRRPGVAPPQRGMPFDPNGRETILR